MDQRVAGGVGVLLESSSVLGTTRTGLGRGSGYQHAGGEMHLEDIGGKPAKACDGCPLDEVTEPQSHEQVVESHRHTVALLF